MKKITILIVLLINTIVFSSDENSIQSEVKMSGWIGRQGNLTVISTGTINFGNLMKYDGRTVAIDEDVIIRDTSLNIGEKARIKLYLDSKAEITNGTTTLTIIPSFEKYDLQEHSLEITGNEKGENHITFPIYARIIGTKESITTGNYKGSFNIRAEYEN